MLAAVVKGVQIAGDFLTAITVECNIAVQWLAAAILTFQATKVTQFKLSSAVSGG